ncbi:hypothetical protein ACU6WZ_18895 [Streptomyces hypolithicus]
MGYFGEPDHVGGLAAWGEAGEQVAWHDDEGLGVLDVAKLGQVFGVGHALALDEDVPGGLYFVQGRAVSVVAGGADEPERHVALRGGWLGNQDATE